MDKNRESAQEHDDGKIELEADKSYTAKEVAEKVKEAVDFIGQQSRHNQFKYSDWDVYYLIRDLLRYANRYMEGEFVLKRLKKGTWRIEYMTEAAGKRKDDQKHLKELRRTADYLAELTGHRPPWG